MTDVVATDGAARTSELVDEFLRCLEKGTPADFDGWAPDVLADVVVPDWRFTCLGPSQLRADLVGDLTVPAELLELRRHPIPTGEAVEMTLRFEPEGEQPTVSRMLWLFEGGDGLITRVAVWCGGDWHGDRLVEMAEAADARGVPRAAGFPA